MNPQEPRHWGRAVDAAARARELARTAIRAGWESRNRSRFDDAVAVLTKPRPGGEELPSEFELDLARLDLGDCLLRLERFEEAIACFDLCSSRPVRGPARFGKAVALQGMGLLEEAAGAYEVLLAEHAPVEEALANLIAIHVELFRLPQVEEYSRRLLELNPQSTAALKGLAVVLIERHDFSTAARCLFQLSNAAPETGDRQEGIEYRFSQSVIRSLEEANWVLAGHKSASAAANGLQQ